MEGQSGRLEPAWRASRLPADRRRCVTLVLVVALLAALRGAVSVLDALLQGAPGGSAAVLLRDPALLGLAPSVLALLFVVLLQRASTPAALDRVMLVAVALLVAGLLLERGAGTPVDVVSVITVVAMIWTLLPQPLAIRMLLALLLSVPVSVQLLLQPADDPQRLVADLLVLATVNVFAGWLSVREHAARRAQFRFLEVSGRLRDRAERMRRLLPVCAWCARLRDEAGYWRALNEFIDEGDLDAVATAECDACRARGAAGSGITGRAADNAEATAAGAAAAPGLPLARQQLTPLIVAVLFVSLGFMAQDLLRSGAVALESTAFRLRSFSVLVTVAVLIFARSTARRGLFDLVITVWALWVSSLLLYFMISGEALVVPSVVALGMVSMAFGLPVPAPLRAIPAALLLAGGLWLVLRPAAGGPWPGGGAFDPAALRLAADFLVGFCAALWFSIEAERHRLALRAAEQEVASQRRITNRLGALLPVCRSCRSVRDGDGYWRDVRSHMQRAADSRATHGICERCLGTQLDVSAALPSSESCDSCESAEFPAGKNGPGFS